MFTKVWGLFFRMSGATVPFLLLSLYIPIMSQKIKAVVLPKAYGQFQVELVDKPIPGPGQLLVRNKAVAINPVDW